jgi:hypothetical protein
MRHFTRWTILLAALGLSFLAALFFMYYRCNNPAVRVDVGITHLPRHTSFVCVVAEVDGSRHAMIWYVSGIFGFFTVSASSQGDLDPLADSDQLVRRWVAWEVGDRYGVVRRSADGLWEITWFEARQVPLQRRSSFLGPVEVVFDIPQGRTERLAEQDVKRLSLLGGR